MFIGMPWYFTIDQCQPQRRLKARAIACLDQRAQLFSRFTAGCQLRAQVRLVTPAQVERAA
ncbi:hypothetical protein D3C81_1966480 [compost metagenome]